MELPDLFDVIDAMTEEADFAGLNRIAMATHYMILDYANDFPRYPKKLPFNNDNTDPRFDTITLIAITDSLPIS